MISSLNSRTEECVDDCQDCRLTCLQSIGHCLEVGGEHANPTHLRLLAATADICAMSARLMDTGADLHTRIWNMCAEVCDACALECEQFDDDVLARCVQICRACAASCRAVSRAVARGGRPAGFHLYFPVHRA